MHQRDSLDAIAKGALWEFSDASDFAWKVPSFIASQRRIEARKLRDETDGATRELRAQLERRKLFGVFSFLLANGTLFAVVSLFEVYLFRLVLVLERQTGRSRTSVRGQGVAQALAFLRACGVSLQRIRSWPQIDAMLRIRNCMMHASGVLAHSRDREEIRRLIASEEFLDPPQRGKDHDEPFA